MLINIIPYLYLKTYGLEYINGSTYCVHIDAKAIVVFYVIGSFTNLDV